MQRVNAPRWSASAGERRNFGDVFQPADTADYTRCRFNGTPFLTERSADLENLTAISVEDAQRSTADLLLLAAHVANQSLQETAAARLQGIRHELTTTPWSIAVAK